MKHKCPNCNWSARTSYKKKEKIYECGHCGCKFTPSGEITFKPA